MSVPEADYAFPWVSPEIGEMCPGMTLLDWFAGQALAGLMANADMPFAHDYAEAEPKQIASGAYDIARAMLVERAKAVS